MNVAKIEQVDGTVKLENFTSEPSLPKSVNLALNLNQADVLAYQKDGGDLLTELADGQALKIKGFFSAGDKSELFLSEDGEIEVVEFDSIQDDGPLKVSYVTSEFFTEDISAFVFADEVVASPLLGIENGPLAAVGGALVLVGVMASGGSNDNNDGGDISIGAANADQLTISTVLSDSISGTGIPGQTITIDIDGDEDGVVHLYCSATHSTFNWLRLGRLRDRHLDV